jgi:hypothetical protein
MTITANKLELPNNNKQKMLSYVFSILKSFFLVGLLGAFLFGIFRSIKTGSFHGFIDGMQFGLFLAIVMVPIIVFLDVLQRIKNYRKYKKVDFNISQTRNFLLKEEYNSICNYLYNILKTHKDFSIYKKDFENGIIKADANASWKSFGEKIQISIMKGSRGKIFVEISSKPKIAITMLDYAKNFENVEWIADKLKCNSIFSS